MAGQVDRPKWTTLTFALSLAPSRALSLSLSLSLSLCWHCQETVLSPRGQSGDKLHVGVDLSSDAGSYLRPIDCLHHSTLGLKVIKKKKKKKKDLPPATNKAQFRDVMHHETLDREQAKRGQLKTFWTFT